MSSKEDYLDNLLNSVMEESEPERKSGETDADNGKDVTELLDSMPEDKDLSEINDLLKQSDEGSKASLADDMLALLEQADAKGRENDTEQSGYGAQQDEKQDEPYDFFAADDSAEEKQEHPDETADDGNAGQNENINADAITDTDDSAEWAQLLEPAQSKEEEKAQKKLERQQEKEKKKEEKKKAKEEKARIKAEKAQEKAKAKAQKNPLPETEDPEFAEADTDLIADEENMADAGEREKKEKKNGFFARLFGGLLEEIPEKEEQEIDISDENRAIMEEVEKEEINPKKGKKKKGKKGAKDQSDEDGEESTKDDKKSKKAAKKKEKQEKKAKKAEEKEFLQEPPTKLPRKKVISIFAFCLTLLAMIIIGSLFIPSYLDRKEARKAYYNGDYESVYRLLSGENLSKSDAILYERSVLVLYFDNKLEAYQLYQSLGEEKEALNELLTAVAFYQKNTERANEYGALAEMQPGYEKILNLLQDSFQVSETEAVEIAQMEPLDYNKALYRILYGTEFTIPEMTQEQETSDRTSSDSGQTDESQNGLPAPEIEDPLPEENEMLQPDSNMTDDNISTPPAQAVAEPGAESGTEPTAEPDTEPADDGQLLYSGTVEDGQVIFQ